MPVPDPHRVGSSDFSVDAKMTQQAGKAADTMAGQQIGSIGDATDSRAHMRPLFPGASHLLGELREAAESEQRAG